MLQCLEAEVSSAGRMDVSFVFSLIDADILSCLFLPRFAKLSPSNWHAPSLRSTVTHWCLHPPSLCISRFVSHSRRSLVCFLLCVSLSSPAHCPPPSHISITPIIPALPSRALFDLSYLILPLLFPLCPSVRAELISISSISFFPHSLPHTCFSPQHPAYSSASLPPPSTCLCSTPVNKQLCRTHSEVNIGSCYGGIE